MLLQPTNTSIIRFITIITIGILLSSCGKKPGYLEAPDAERSTFPQVYPAHNEKIPGKGPQLIDKENNMKNKDYSESELSTK